MINGYHPYTLYCQPGHLFRSEEHYLFIGDWMPYNSIYVILAHGKLTEEEYRQFMSQDKVNIFEDAVTGTLAIYNRMSRGYMQKLENDGKSIQDYIQYVGCLDRDRYNKYLWKGYVHRK